MQALLAADALTAVDGSPSNEGYPPTDDMGNLKRFLLGLAVWVVSGVAGAAPPADGAGAARAIARFGYGAKAPGVGDGADGRAWALQALRTARAASLRPPAVPEELSGFELPVPDVYSAIRADLAERRRAATPRKDPKFSAILMRRAAFWRLQACSRPELEPPLLARMSEFWFNHFNVGTQRAGPLVGHYLLHAIRPHALGRFEDLLVATARHPAMLRYLDLGRSVAEGRGRKGINENYAREVMELHTLGIQGGYTQHDVRELARVLTGWQVDELHAADGFVFRNGIHDQGEKVVLGRHFHPAGLAEGEEALRLLARQPATARRVAGRLAEWFVRDQPPPRLVEELASTFLASGGDIFQVMQVLISAPETWEPGARLVRTPFDFACSTLAATGAGHDRRGLSLALAYLARAGQPVNAWATPDGYPTDETTWLTREGLAQRIDFATQLINMFPPPENATEAALQRLAAPSAMYK